MAALRVGDTVNVPGGMHGTLKFIGTVDGKNGTFAGVELASEYAARGKNSGDVGGKHYFRTTVPGGGIFLPVDKAEKRMSGSSATSSTKQPSFKATSVAASPNTPAAVRPKSRTSGMVKPSFSQSVGPSLQQRVASPAPTTLKPPRRESLARPTSPLRPRPISPLRKTQNPPPAQTPAAGRLQTPKTRPSIGLAKSTIGPPGTAGKSGLRAPSLANGGPNKFSQSLRQSTSRTPSRMRGAPSFSTATTPLGPDDRFDEDDTILEQNEPDITPTPTPNVKNPDRTSVENAEKLSQEAQRLKEQLQERDRQLGEQANSIAEMERSLVELQSMIPEAMGQRPQAESDLPRDVQALRAQLKEKNEKIKALMAEFDANRADFRSTIDTLEMASTETERVYEQRVEDLLQQVQHLQERNDDVDSVAQQFKQLEELVQELEEGLEESRRAEAEARSEVEFLRGEVERGKSELRRERERAGAQAALEGGAAGGGISNEELEELNTSLTQKEDEIRGLKAIIQSLQGTAPQDQSSYAAPTTPKANGVYTHHSKSKSTNILVSPEGQASSDALQRQIHDLESLLQQKSSHEEELQEEVRQLRQSVNVSSPKGWPFPGGTSGALGLGHRRTESQADKHNSGGSQRTIVGQAQTPHSPSLNGHRRKDSTVPELADQPSRQIDGRGSPLKDAFGIDTEGSEEANEDRRRRSAEQFLKIQAPPSVSETSTAALWCEICEESGHDILNCANMMGSSTHRQPSPQPQFRTGRDAVREGLKRSGYPSANHNDRPAPLRKTGSLEPPSQAPDTPLPPPPARSGSLAAQSNGEGSNRSSATPAGSAQAASSTTATPTKPTLIEGTGDQAGMLAGKISGVIDPDRWCALCERDGHESVDCPVEDAF